MHDVFGIDVNLPATRARPWEWFLRQVEGVVNRPPIAYTTQGEEGGPRDLVPLFGTRVQTRLQERAAHRPRTA